MLRLVNAVVNVRVLAAYVHSVARVSVCRIWPSWRFCLTTHGQEIIDHFGLPFTRMFLGRLDLPIWFEESNKNREPAGWPLFRGL